MLKVICVYAIICDLHVRRSLHRSHRSFCDGRVGYLQLLTRVVFFRMATELANKKAEREALRGVIQQWNANRLDLFELSEPNEVSTIAVTAATVPIFQRNFSKMYALPGN